MDIRIRKGLIGLVGFLIILVIWFVYYQYSHTPLIETKKGSSKNAISEVNIAELRQNTGKVGDVCVGQVEIAKFIKYNKDKTASREFGFEKLLHKQDNEWQLQKPYMSFYQSKMDCSVTAEQGNLHVESALSAEPAAKDAKFTGNVIITINPKGKSKIGKSTIYLDDIVYIASKSMFTTAGPIRLESDKAQMAGSGFELVYNEETGKLEYFKINKLNSCKFQFEKSGTPFSPKKEKTAANTVSNNTKSAPGGKKMELVTEQPVTSGGEYYKCVLMGNVVIQTENEIAVADEVSIDKLLFNDKSNDDEETLEIDPGKKPVISDTENKNAEAAVEDNNNLVQVSVSCDKGMIVVPENLEVEKMTVTEANNPRSADELVTDKTRAVCIAKEIHYQVPTNEIYLKSSSLWMKQPDENGTMRKYLLAAPNLDVLFAKDEEKVKGSIVPDIKNLNAYGKTVKIAYVKLADKELLGGVELKCQKMNFESSTQQFTASGPGVIKIDNSKIADTSVKNKGFSFQKPCYALVRDFAEMKYTAGENKLIADAKTGQVLNIDYVSLLGGKEDKRISATANHIDADLKDLENSKTELDKLNASGGVTYEEESQQGKGKLREIQMVGSYFSYDAGTSLLTLKGDENRMAFFNGTKVDGVEYNLDTARFKTDKIGGGSFNIKK